MAITSVDTFLAALPGQLLPFNKGPSATLQAVGQYYSPWLLAGLPGAGVAPSSGVAGDVPTKNTAGAIPFTNPAFGINYLAKLAHSPNVAGVLMVYDRLWHNSGLSTTLLTAQTVNSVALPARCPVAGDPSGETFDTNGLGAEPWLDVSTVLGAGATAPSISYTNEQGVAGRTGTLLGFAATAAVGRAFPFGLAAGDRGVRSIQTYTNGATMTSGAFHLVLRRRLASIVVSTANIGAALDWAAIGLPGFPADACLEFLWIPSATTAVVIAGDMIVAQG